MSVILAIRKGVHPAVFRLCIYCFIININVVNINIVIVSVVNISILLMIYKIATIGILAIVDTQ